MRKTLLALSLLLAPGVAYAQYSGPIYNPANVKITGGTVFATGATPPSVATAGAQLGALNDGGSLFFIDPIRTANNRVAYAEWGDTNLTFGFGDDAFSDGKNALTITGGYAQGISAIASNSGSGAWTHTGAFNVVGSVSATGNVNVQGNVSSTANTNPAGPTNSGIALSASPNVADALFFDASQTANNRTWEWLSFQGALRLRAKNDAGNGATDAIAVSGGYASGITGIASNSGTGAWAHTGAFSATGSITASGGLQLPVATVGALPACSSTNQGMMYAVSDANAPTYNGALTGGGSGATATIPVMCNGTAWTAH
jgi:hypothetical protein